jgi:hypothetical protein
MYASLQALALERDNVEPVVDLLQPDLAGMSNVSLKTNNQSINQSINQSKVSN